MIRTILYASLAALLIADAASATVIFGLMIDPATVANTSANGVSSIRSGANTWQLYALDDSNTDFGISSYDVTLANITGNVLHRSPETNIQGIDGDFFQSGFTVLRTGPTNPIQASPPLPGLSPFLIAGFGQTAGNFVAASQAVDPQSTVVGPTVSGNWGDYLSPLVAPALWGGHHWLFMAEGNYNAGIQPSITKSAATVYSNKQNFQSALVSTRNIVFAPEPGSIVLAGLALVGLLGLTRHNLRRLTMNSHTFQKAFFAGFAALLLAARADASVIIGLDIDPPTIANTAASGVTSTRSGPGTWQLYALDTSTTDFGISSYSITMSNTTAINHRSTNATVNDNNGDPQTAGFSGLRSGTNTNPIVASQGLPGSTPFLITGFGQSGGTVAAKTAAIDPASSVQGTPTSGTWGTYTDPALAPVGGHNWFFLAEGLYDSAGPKPTVSAATATVYIDANFTSAATPTTACLFCELEMAPVVNPLLLIANTSSSTLSATITASNNPTSWGPTAAGFTLASYTPGFGAPPNSLGPHFPATWDPLTQAFSWNPMGSSTGDYVWNVSATNAFGTGNGTITVELHTPEPTSLILLVTAALGLVGFTRSAAGRSRASF